MTSSVKIKNVLALAAEDLAVYAVANWPGFELARHHEIVIEKLEAVERGEIDRLMIFMPPRAGKSMIASQFFPSWYLGRHPDRYVISASYGQELANDFGRKVRNLVVDPLHRGIFPCSELADDSSAAHRFNLIAGGAYHAVGAGGPVTGRGAHLLLIDDAVKNREEAYSAKARQALREWYQSVAYTRLMPGGAVVLIQTRWHEDDLAGWLLREHASEGWQVVSLSATAERDEVWRKEGEALWPSRFPLNVLARTREAIGSAAWMAMYQQRPVAEEGAVFNRHWWRQYQTPPDCRRIVFSLDTAFKTTESSDYSVIEVWGETATAYCLLHVFRQRAEFPELKRQAINLAETWRPQAVLIEDAASGQSLIQSLRAETRLPVLPVKPLGDKVVRANAITPLVESGRVHLPETAPWLADFMDEANGFPAAPHDDQIDALSQALSYLRRADPVEGYKALLRAAAMGDRTRRGNDQAEKFDSAIIAYQQARVANEQFNRELQALMEEEPPNHGRILPSVVTFSGPRVK
jgi:predicted phage terminase large subunit-like protein